MLRAAAGGPLTNAYEKREKALENFKVAQAALDDVAAAIGSRLQPAELANAAQMPVAEAEAHLAAGPRTEPTWRATADPGTLRDELAAETARLLSTLDNSTTALLTARKVWEQTNRTYLEDIINAVREAHQAGLSIEDIAGLTGTTRIEIARIVGDEAAARVLPDTTGKKPRGRTFEALSVPNFRRFFIGQVISNLGTNMAIFAQDWLVLDLSHGKAGALGIVTLAQFAPQVAMTLFAGTLADRAKKRGLLIRSQADVAVTMVIQGLLTATGLVAPWHIYLIAVAAGLFSALGGPVQSTFIRELVGNMFDGPWVTTLADTVSPQSPFLIGGIVTAAVATLTAPFLIRHEKIPHDVSEWTSDTIARIHTLLREERKSSNNGDKGQRITDPFRRRRR